MNSSSAERVAAPNGVSNHRATRFELLSDTRHPEMSPWLLYCCDTGVIVQPTLSIRKILSCCFLALFCLLTGCVTQPGDQQTAPEPHIQAEPENQLLQGKTEPVPPPARVILSQRDKFYSRIGNRQLWQLPRVEEQYQNYLAQTQLSALLERRWKQYFGYVLAEVNARGLPSELAVVPLVESMLDPYAFSQNAAVGMWQFVGSTARENGLLINWWYDARRDPVQSTDAALNYLQKLFNRFQDWPLALAAYNGGAARISRAMAKQGKNNFWDLKLSGETANYVPRIIAFSRFLAQAPQFDLTWPLPEQPAFVEVFSAGQIDLARTAKKMNMTTEDIYLYNPGLNRWATPPMGPHRLLVQHEHASALRDVLDGFSEESAWQRYTIKNGDSLSRIAQKFHIETRDLKKTNGLKNNKIRAGDALIVPGSHQVAADHRLLGNPFLFASTRLTNPRVYRVKAGDSFWSIARKFKMNMNKLIKANRLNSKQALKIGQQLLI